MKISRKATRRKDKPANSRQFMEMRTAGMKLGLGALALGVCVTAKAGLPLEVNVLNSQYTTYVFVQTNFSSASGGGAIGDIVIWPGDGVSRATVSPSPFSDSIYLGSIPTPLAQANGAMFGAYSFADTSQALYVTSMMNNLATAGAQTEISFSPLTSGTTTIDLEFLGYDNWYNSAGSVSLFDVTANQTLWNYDWYQIPGSPLLTGTVPWTATPNAETTASATLSLDTDFNATDTYTLTLYSQAFSNNDNEGTAIQLSGIEAVPEPSVFALVSLGAAAWLTLHRRGHASARSGLK